MIHCNGFKIRAIKECDKLAVQSSHQSTWFVGRRGFFGLGWHEVALQRDELMVLRAYDGAAPVFELVALGERVGVLSVELSRGQSTALRVGSRCVVELGENESCVLHSEWIQHPRSPGVQPGAYGQGLRV